MDGSKRVLHVIDSLDLGGAQTFLYHALKHFPDPSYEFEVAALHGPGVYSEKFEEAGFKVHHLAASKFDPRLVLRLGRLIRSGTFDIVHAHLVISSFLCEWRRHRWALPRLIIHVQNDFNWRLDSGYQKPLQRRLGRHADLVLGCSQRAVDSLAMQRPRRVLYNGVDTNAFQPATERQRLNARSQFGYGDEDIVIGYTGRLVHQKNPSLLVSAFADAAQKRPNLKLLLIGAGPLEGQLRELAEQRGVTSKINFAGFRMDIEECLHALDLFAFPSIYEGFGISLVEAMACALPCIASDYPAVHEIIVETDEGVIFPNGDQASLSEAFLSLTADRKKRLLLGKNARRRAVKTFDYAQIGDQLKTCYCDLIHAKRS